MRLNMEPNPRRHGDCSYVSATHTNPPWEGRSIPGGIEFVCNPAEDARNERWERRAEELIRRDERRRCAAQVRSINAGHEHQRPTDTSLLIEAIARGLEAQP